MGATTASVQRAPGFSGGLLETRTSRAIAREAGGARIPVHPAASRVSECG